MHIFYSSLYSLFYSLFSLFNSTYLACILEGAFQASAKAISEEFGLSLFGFDVIIPVQDASTGPHSHLCQRESDADLSQPSAGDLDSHSHSDIDGDSLACCQVRGPKSKTRRLVGKPLVIDVNFFPSYKEVADFPQRLRRFLRKKAGM